MPKAVTPSAPRILRNPGPEPSPSMLPTAQPLPCSVSTGRHTKPVPATIEELLQPLRDAPDRSAVLLDVDGVLAPIVQQPDDAHMPETTRRPLIEVARRYGVGRLRVGPAGLGRAADRLARLDRLPRLARQRGAQARLDRPRARPGAAGLDAPRAALRPRRLRREAAPAARAPRGQGGDRRPALARDARRGGVAGARSRRSRRRPRRPASSPTGAARCSRSARPCGSTRAPGSSACCTTRTSPPRSTSATT